LKPVKVVRSIYRKTK